MTPTWGMPAGESLSFSLEPTLPPSWSGWSVEAWQSQVGMILRLQLEAQRESWEPWTLAYEIGTATGTAAVEVP